MRTINLGVFLNILPSGLQLADYPAGDVNRRLSCKFKPNREGASDNPSFIP